jgi:alkylation response protein AidB-like acyl-CoA dehydrogenase
MDFTIPEELILLKRTAKRFVDEECRPYEEIVERSDVIPDDILRKLTKKSIEVGLWALNSPAEYGGGDVGMLGLVLVSEEFGKTCPVFCRFLTRGGDAYVARYGTEDQKQRYLIPAIRGEKRNAICMTEPNAGTDISMIQTGAVKKEGGYVINGTKQFTTGGHIADYFWVFAVTDKSGGPKKCSCFIVDRNTPGLTISKPVRMMGRAGTFPTLEYFEDCFVPAENLLGELGQGFEIFGSVYGSGRGVTGGMNIGATEYLLELSRDYANIRIQFEQPIGQRQFIQGMIADMTIQLEAARWLTYNFAWEFDQGKDVRHKSSIVKVFTSDMVCQAADMALQIHGGMGYSKELPVERFYRDARFIKIAGGTSEILRWTIARNILKHNVRIGID